MEQMIKQIMSLADSLPKAEYTTVEPPWPPDSLSSLYWQSTAAAGQLALIRLIKAVFRMLITHGTRNPLSFRQNLKTATENK
jgi:hypothetical protein